MNPKSAGGRTEQCEVEKYLACCNHTWTKPASSSSASSSVPNFLAPALSSSFSDSPPFFSLCSSLPFFSPLFSSFLLSSSPQLSVFPTVLLLLLASSQLSVSALSDFLLPQSHSPRPLNPTATCHLLVSYIKGPCQPAAQNLLKGTKKGGPKYLLDQKLGSPHIHFQVLLFVI